MIIKLYTFMCYLKGLPPPSLLPVGDAPEEEPVFFVPYLVVHLEKELKEKIVLI